MLEIPTSIQQKTGLVYAKNDYRTSRQKLLCRVRCKISTSLKCKMGKMNSLLLVFITHCHIWRYKLYILQRSLSTLIELQLWQAWLSVGTLSFCVWFCRTCLSSRFTFKKFSQLTICDQKTVWNTLHLKNKKIRFLLIGVKSLKYG